MIALSTSATARNVADRRKFPVTTNVDSGIGERLKAAMRHTASTIVVVTARGEMEPRGVTVSTFTMVSLDPAIVSFSLQRHAQMEAVLRTTDRFHVHILKADQASLAHRFAERGRKGWEQFEGLPMLQGDEPRLPGVLATITSIIHGSVPVGDHTIVLGQVTDIDVQGGSPLLYHDRAFYHIGGRVEEMSDRD